MTFLQLSTREWTRRPLRSGIAAAGIALATAALFSLLAFQTGYTHGLRRELDRLGAHILLAPKGCPFDAASMALHGASWPCYLKEEYLDEVRSVPGVASAAPVFMSAVYENDAPPNVYLGIQKNLLQLKPGWRITGHFPESPGDILVGSEVVRQRGWRTGQSVPLPGLHGASGTIAGILEPTHGPDDTFIFLRLADAQEIFHHPRALTHILVRLTTPDELDQAVSQLRGCDAGLAMNVIPLAHIFRSIQSLINSTRALLGCIALGALLVAAAGVGNTVMLAVFERTRDLGILRALGSSRRQVFSLVWLEALQFCFAGAIAGILLAWLSSRTVESWVRARLPFAPAESLLRWEWWIAAACLAGPLLVGSIAALLPAWQATRLSPVTAIRA